GVQTSARPISAPPPASACPTVRPAGLRWVDKTRQSVACLTGCRVGRPPPPPSERMWPTTARGARWPGRPGTRRKARPVTPTPALSRRGSAERWLEALPLGNGRLGAMVWGDPARPRFSLNESTLWSGGPGVDAPHRTPRREAEAALTRSRALFESGAVPEAQSEIERLGASWSQAYLPVGDLSVRLQPAAGAAATGAVPPPAARILDPPRADHRAPAAAAEPLPSAGARPVLELDSPLQEEQREGGDGSLTVVLRAPSDVPGNQFRRSERIGWDPEGASRAAVVVRTRREGERLLVVCAIATTWQGLGRVPDRAVHEALEEATAQAEAALARGEQELRRRHRGRTLPGAHEVALQLSGSAEAELLATSFAYGRYLLASASRPGLPP